MADDAFDGQILVDKLSKLNSSQQSIESLSRWCISHRKKAKQIVESWNKSFESAQRDQRVSFLYLANDILQNSRRKGSEFVNEFWKVLPAALKTVYGAGDENGKKAASRLVNIWEERKVFGSRGQNLKDEMLGKNPPPDPTTLVSNIGKNSNPVKIVKRDAHALRIKLTVGAMPEKIIMSFQSVHDQNGVEEAALNKFKGAIIRAGEIERDAEVISTQGGNLQGSPLVDEMLEQENVLQQCITQLENSEAARASLVSQLKQALQDHEPQLELLRTQLQVARGQLDQVIHLRERLTSQPMIIHSQQMDPMRAAEVNTPLPHLTTPPPPPAQAVKISSATSKTTEEENKKAAAAAVAAKLAASTSSAQMLTSVLSSLVAESMSGGSGSKSAGFSSGLSMFPPEKRAKLEKPMSVDVNNSEAGGNAAYFNQMQATPFLPQAPPPPPPGAPSNSPTNQFAQSGGHMMVAMPYGYGGGSSLPPPPPMPMGLAMPAPPPQHPQSSQSQQQGSNGGGYYRPPGIGFYGQSQQPTPPPPMQRQ